MKNLGSFMLVLLVILIIIGAFGVHSYVSEMSPAWNARYQAQTQLALADQQNAIIEGAKRRADFTEAMRDGLLVLLTVVVGFAAIMIWRQYDMRQESRMRAVDGTFALQSFSSNGQVYLVDPNKALFGVQGFNKLTGDIITDAQMVGPDRQLTYANNVQRTRSIAAKQVDGRKPSRNELLAESGFFDNKARVEDARAQLVERRLLASEAPALVDDNNIMALPNNWRPLSLTDAFHQSTPERWLLGQNENGPCEFNISDCIHTGLLGATGTGKTASTALLMAYNARQSGMHVIALDGKGGVDWAQHGQYLEAWPTDYTMIADQVGEIIRLHDIRMKDIKRAKVENIYQLDYQIPPLFIVMEEFGYTMQALRAASKKRHDKMEGELSNLMRVSRATGIYFLLIDQSAEHWPGVIKANVKGWFAYRLGGQQGNAFNAYELHKLKPKGQFWHNDNVYDAWFTKAEAKQLQRELQPVRTKLLTNVEYTTIDSDDSAIDGAGVSKGQNATRVYDSAVDKIDKITPVDDSAINGEKAPRLTGKPLSRKECNLVLNTHAMTGSINETCRLLWGGWTVSRGKWVKEIIGKEVLQ